MTRAQPSKIMTLAYENIALPSQKVTLPSNSLTFNLCMKERLRALDFGFWVGGFRVDGVKEYP